MVGVVVRLKGSQQTLPVFFPLLFDRDNTWWWGRAAPVHKLGSNGRGGEFHSHIVDIPTKLVNGVLQLSTGVHSQIADTDFRSGAYTITSLGGEAHNPWTRIVNVYLRVSGVDRR